MRTNDSTSLSTNSIFHDARSAVLRQYSIVVTALMTVYSYWLATGRTWSATHTDANQFGADFFRIQADAILQGRLNVPFMKYAWTECMFIDGKCYGYFGIFPSILRMPEFLITGSRSVNHIPVYIALGVGVCVWFSLDLFVRMMSTATTSLRLSADLANRILILGTLLIGPASVLVFLSEPAVYEEAILWALTMTMVSVNMVMRWIEGRRYSYLVIAIIAGAAATNSRVSAVPVVLSLGAALLYLRFSTGSAEKDRLGFRLELGLMVIPAAAYGLLMYAKYGQLSMPWNTLRNYDDPVMIAIRNSNGGSLTGARFVLTNLVQYLRPDSLAISSIYPWVQFRIVTPDDAFFVAPIVRVGMQVDHALSFTNSMFVQLMLTVTAGFATIKRCLRTRILDDNSLILFATATGAAPALMIFFIAARYQGDFYPFLTVGSIAGLIVLATTTSMSDSMKRTILDISIGLACVSTFVWYILQINRW